MENDIRWIQRLDSYTKACNRVLEITESDRNFYDLSELEKEGLIQRFEYTFELAWKVLQDYLQFLGFQFQTGPNSTLQMAFENGLINNHDAWRCMVKTRITTSCMYDVEDAREIVANIYNEYSYLFNSLLNMLNDKKLVFERNSV